MLSKTDDEHAITMPEILAALEHEGIKAERKSIYDDFRALSDFGIEIEGEKVGKSFCYRVVKRDFEIAELKLLVDAIQSSKFITEKKSRALIKKIESFASDYDARKLQRQVFVQGRIKTMNESIYYSVDNIHTAIAENKMISFQYFSWNVKKEMELRRDGKVYEISPWGLSWDDENYYLVAFDGIEEKVKHFRVDKMLNIKVIDKPREGKKELSNLDMAEYAKMSFGMFGGEQTSVRLELDNSMVGVIIDRFGKDIPLRPSGTDKCIATVNVAVSDQFYGWIFGLGGKVRITSPDYVVEGMKERVDRMSNLY